MIDSDISSLIYYISVTWLGTCIVSFVLVALVARRFSKPVVAVVSSVAAGMIVQVVAYGFFSSSIWSLAMADPVIGVEN